MINVDKFLEEMAVKVSAVGTSSAPFCEIRERGYQPVKLQKKLSYSSTLRDYQQKLSMAKSKDSYLKREKEKKRQQEREKKKEKMEQRKANAGKGLGLDEMLAYIDENGNLSSTPPDPSKKAVINAEDIQISVPKYVPDENDNGLHEGIVAFFNGDKGFGFINDSKTGERIFAHISQLSEPISENDRVGFEVERGEKGFVAVNVQKLPK